MSTYTCLIIELRNRSVLGVSFNGMMYIIDGMIGEKMTGGAALHLLA